MKRTVNLVVFWFDIIIRITQIQRSGLHITKLSKANTFKLASFMILSRTKQGPQEDEEQK